MSKYYKAEDVIRKRAEDLADTSYWEWGNPKNVDDWIEVAEMEFADLPTIEVMEYPQVEGITPTLVTPAVSEDCISRKWLEENKQVVSYTNEWGETEINEYICWEDVENAPNVVSTTEPQTENIKVTCDMVGSKNEIEYQLPKCEKCINYGVEFTEDDSIDTCLIDECHYEPKDEPQCVTIERSR